MKSKTKALVSSISIPLLAGAVSAYISRDGMKMFKTLVKPPLSPPAALFPIVWTLLYTLMGIAAYRILTANADADKTDRALTLYAVQLGVNFFWSIFFFKFGMYLFAFFWLILLWALILLTIRAFKGIDRKAAYMLIPYIVWVTFAAYLNFGIYRLN